MLVLSRKPGERVQIGSTIEVRVLATGRRTVRLGFSAPAEVPIHREEVSRRIESDTQPARSRLPARDTVRGIARLTSIARLM